MVIFHPGTSLLLSKTALGVKDKDQKERPKEGKIQIQFNLFNVKSKYFTQTATKASRSD